MEHGIKPDCTETGKQSALNFKCQDIKGRTATEM